jgi:23S rRNA (cytosine1962-C5)-methyltransferase
VAEVCDSQNLGETVSISSSSGEFLAWGSYSPNSQIRARIWSWNSGDIIDGDYINERIAHSINIRRGLFGLRESDSVRLVHGESDGLPGLIVDQYGELIVVQFLAAGVEYWREVIIDAVQKSTGCHGIYERSDVEVRKLEGLPLRKGIVYGEQLMDQVVISEHGLKFIVDIASGQKTGFYLDQRDNRLLVRNMVNSLEVLDCFCYTGGFTLNALQGICESVISIDSSAKSLSILEENIYLNNFTRDRVKLIEGDVFVELRKFRDRGKLFDLIVLDPPKFAHTPSQADKAARGYKDINLLAFKLLRPGGHLVTFSCSGGIQEDFFQKIVAGAALDAGVQTRIVKRLQQGADHPVALNFPQGAYLKGFVIRVSR